jgi:hypothetical protein
MTATLIRGSEDDHTFKPATDSTSQVYRSSGSAERKEASFSTSLNMAGKGEHFKKRVDL